MDRTKAAAIVNDFFADMNPSLWNGSTSMPKSFDDRAWQYPLADDVNLEITFVYNEEDGWCHYCDLVYQSDDSSFDMLSGYGIDSILNVTDTGNGSVQRLLKEDRKIYKIFLFLVKQKEKTYEISKCYI